MRKLFLTLSILLISLTAPSVVWAAGDAKHPEHDVHWHFSGMLGSFDKQSIQRGYQVYREVCASCHSMDLLSFRNLTKVGFSPEAVKYIAAEYECANGFDDAGDVLIEACTPANRFPSPYSNENQAKAANGGAIPPDLSLIIKARHDGANYVYSLLAKGYEEKTIADLKYAPLTAGVTVDGKEYKAEDVYKLLKDKDANKTELNAILAQVKANVEAQGINWNPYMPGFQIAMAKPISGDDVEYTDGTQATLEQETKDLVNFLQWAAEPEMEERKKMGIKVLIFLSIFTLLFYIAKIRTWGRLKKED